MRNLMIRILAMNILVIIACWSTESSAGLFKVVRVYDGDTVKAVGHDIEIKVRLVGIDAPETSKGKRKPGQPFARRAEKHLAGLVLNKTVDIKGYGSDRYGRILAEIYLYEKNINLEMVKTGYAEVYSGSPPRGFYLKGYQKAETLAKNSYRGIWSQGPDYISPAFWRKNQKKDDKLGGVESK
jgi:endonuclease YncB( thermonuclease family)